jgi:hypothetical protein
MDERFSPTIFLYGMALMLAMGKAFTLTIWRTLPKARPGLKEEMLQAWRDRRLRKQAVASQAPHSGNEQTADDPSRTAEEVKGQQHATMLTPAQGSATQPRSNPSP